MLVRGENHRTPSLADLEEVVRQADPDLALIRPATLRETVNREMVTPRFYTSLLAAFAGLAVVLTAIGLYGVVAFQVSSRRREIGIRMAVGGEARRIVRQIMRGALAPATLGVVAGLLGAVALTRLLSGLLYNVRPSDPVTWVVVTAVVLLVVLLASSLPASRASRVAPSEVLRSE
jgi:ABC-type antimicrobial peptide transport system permease subunit